ncbi:hypothetical protein BX666DRAFT_1972548 [Dichotomocladium elegans]|nr:hypothetical protein BX666DRAFT_1972548 [Dichotomocladium elegans]
MTETMHPPLRDRLLTLIKHPQFYWWCGHVCLVMNAFLYFMSVLSLHPQLTYYKRAYSGALVSYGIVLWKATGGELLRKLDMEFIRNENVQYFALAFYWYSYHPITVTLLPFLVFSTFHVLAYIPSALAPMLFPEETEDNVNSDSATVQHVCRQIKQITDEHHELAMQVAAYIEVVGVMGQLILGVISFQTSFLALIVFAHFLRLRYFSSPYTRQALWDTTEQLDRWFLPLADDPRRYAQTASKIYANAKGIVIRYGSGSLTDDSNEPTTTTTTTTTTPRQGQN